MKNFLDFVREQGVVGLAVGFILGGAVSKLVASLVADLVNPMIGIVLGKAEGLTEATVRLGSATLLIGNFVAVLIDFIVIALVVYFGVKLLKLDKLDRKNS